MKNIKKIILIPLVLLFSNSVNADTGEDVSAVGTLSSLNITVTAPNGGEIWNAGSTQNITWTGPNKYIKDVKIEFSADNGATWSTINGFVPSSADSSYSWVVPNTPSKNSLIRIIETPVLYGNVMDISDSVFTIDSLSSIQLVAPNGGEVWSAGTDQKITWEIPQHNVSNIKIEYSTDDGTSWSTVVASTPAADSSYNWFVPDTPSENSLVKLSDVTNSSTKDISNSVFTIDSLSSVQIGSLTVRGDNITELSPKKYNISGNVSVNNILKFSGGIVVDVNNLSVKGNGLIFLTGIPVLGKVDLYNGSFSFNVKDALLNGVLQKANNLFKVGNLPIELNNIELLTDGVRLEGKLIFPEIMGNFGAEITTLQVTTSKGISLIGGVHINSISFTGFKLKNLVFNFNTVDNIFEGGGTLVTKPMTITAGVLVTQGKLDSIGVWVVLGNPIPLGTTGLSLSEGGGYIARIAHPPMKLALGISLVPTVQGSYNVVTLDDLQLEYTFGRKLEGSGNLTIFGKGLARAGMVITSRRTSFSGDVNIWDVLLGHVEATISRRHNGNLNFVGNLKAKLQMPAYKYFPFDLVGKIVTLPYTVASTRNHIKNTKIWGDVKLTRIFKLNYKIEWANSGISTTWATKFTLWNYLFSSSIKMNDMALNSINRFEGKSVIINPSELNKSLKIYNNNLVQSFTITNPTPLLIIRLKGDAKTPIYSITLPNGSVIDKNNVSTFSNIEYYEDDVSLKGFYLIQNTQVGKYTLNISNVSTYFLDLYGSNTSPYIKIQEVINNGSDIIIKWDDSDPDDNAKIDLYYDNNNYGANGVLITEGINENDDVNSYNWSIGDMETGNYYIYAAIQDTTNSPVISYFNTPVKIVNSMSPAAPQNLQSSITDSSVTLSWSRPSGSRYNYNVYYSTKGGVNYNSSSFNLGDTSTFKFTNFIPGKEYKFTVTAVDSLYNESDLSNIISVNYISATQNNSPVILNQKFPSAAFTNQQLNYQINTFDSDGDPLTFKIQSGPAGLTIDNAGQLSWIPTFRQIGNNFVSFTIDDNHGLQDSASFRITVLDSLSSKGSVDLNKPYYYGYSEQPIVAIQDVNLNVSPAQIDSQLVHIYSGKDEIGIDLMTVETDANSGIFTAVLNLNNTTSGNNTLSVSSEDSITAVYIDNFPQDTVKSISYFIDSLSTDVKDNFVITPEKYQLFNAYPNPFNPSTTIQYYIPEFAHVRLSIYNALGKLIKILVDKEKEKGNYIVKWNGRNQFGIVVSSGIYFYRFEAYGKEGGKIISKKMFLLK